MEKMDIKDLICRQYTVQHSMTQQNAIKWSRGGTLWLGGSGAEEGEGQSGGEDSDSTSDPDQCTTSSCLLLT